MIKVESRTNYNSCSNCMMIIFIQVFSIIAWVFVFIFIYLIEQHLEDAIP